MPQLITPSAALSGAFELPQVEVKASLRQAQQSAETLNAYGLEWHHLGLLLPIDTPSALIEDELPSCHLPNTPAWLNHMVNWNGTTVPVFDLNVILDFTVPTDAPPTDKILIIGQGDAAAGVQVNTAPFRISLDSEAKLNRHPPLPQALQPFTRACYRTDRIWVEWDYQGFFAALATH